MVERSYPDIEGLLPCPFCGGGANVYENEVDFVTKWSVGCGDCNCNMDVCEDTPADAAVEWNTRPAAKSAWMPIETAPKDNTRILICREDRFPRNTYVARWFKGFWSVGPLTDEWRAYPTHWMPLPAGPSLPSTEGRCPDCPARYANGGCSNCDGGAT